jgi:hypothetical protein
MFNHKVEHTTHGLIVNPLVEYWPTDHLKGICHCC